MIKDVDMRVTMEGDDDIANVSRALIGMDVEHRERDFIHNPKMNGKQASVLH